MNPKFINNINKMSEGVCPQYSNCHFEDEDQKWMNQKFMINGNKMPGDVCSQYSNYYLECEEPKMNKQNYFPENIDCMMEMGNKILNTVQECEISCEQMTIMVMYKQDCQSRMNQLELLRDCADICNLMVRYLARDSIFSKSLADVCAVVCECCGKECSKFSDMESKRCAQICLMCAKECRNFAG